MSTITPAHDTYMVRHRSIPLEALADGQHAAWAGVSSVGLDHFAEDSTSNRPAVRARLAWSADALSVQFQVSGERHVTARHTQHGAMVCEDSCVEFFFQPDASQPGYLNFELNCLGTILCYYIEDPQRRPAEEGGGFARYRIIAPQYLAEIDVRCSLTAADVAAAPGPLDWTLGARVPTAWIARHGGGTAIGGDARGNFYKCADLSAEPHWAAWQPIGAELNFHQPRYFGRLQFEPAG